MNHRAKIFCITAMVLFLSAPLFLESLPAGNELMVYFLDTPGIRGLAAGFLRWLGENAGLTGGAKIYLFLTNLLTCGLSWYFFRKITGENLPALAAGICYSFSVYSVFIRYDGGSMTEAAAYGLLPLCLYGFYVIYSESSCRKRLIGGLWLAAGLTLLFLTSVPTAVLCCFFVVSACLLMWKKTFREICGLIAAGSLALSAVLSSPVLLPYYRAFRAGYVYIRDGKVFSQRAAEVTQLLRTFAGRLNTGSSFGYVPCLGLPLLAAGIAGLIFSAGEKETQDRHFRGLTKTACALGFMALIFCLRIFPWEEIASLHDLVRAGLEQIGYPHRFLQFAVLLFSLLAGEAGVLLSLELRRRGSEKYGFVMGCYMVLAVICAVFTGVYYMNSLMYTTPAVGMEITDPFWLETDYLLYIGK